MIIFPNALLAAAAAAGESLSNPRIGYQTWLRDLDVDDVTVSTDSEDTPGDAMLRPDTSEYWQPTALPATAVFDLGTSRAVDYVGLAGHTLGSSGCAVLVETSDGSFVGSPSTQVWDELGGDISPGVDDALMFLDTSRNCRYVRLTITGGTTMPKIAVCYAGEVLAMPHSIYGGHSPITLSRDTTLYRSLSKGGQFLSQGFKRNGLTGDASFRYLEPDWYRTYFDPFVDSARRYPFFFAWRPADYPLEVAYGWCPDDIKPSNMGVQGFMQVGFQMQAEGHE